MLWRDVLLSVRPHYGPVVTGISKQNDALCGDETLMNSKEPSAPASSPDELVRLYKSGNHAQVLELAEKMLPTYRTNKRFHNIRASSMRHSPGGISLLKTSVETLIEENAAAEILVEYGKQLHRVAEYEVALACHSAAVKSSPTSLLALEWKAHALASLKRYAKAIPIYESVLKLSPENGGVALSLATCFDRMGKTEKTIAAFKRALFLKPKSTKAIDGLIAALERAGHNQEAFKYLQQASHTQPNNSSVHAKLGALYYSSGNYSTAVDHLDKATALNAGDSATWTAKAQAEAGLLKHAQCLKSAGKALALDPKNAMAHTLLGVANRALGHHQKAIWHYKQAIGIDPNLTPPYVNLANLYNSTKRHEIALEFYEKAITTNPKHAKLWSFKCEALRGLGRYEEALAAAERAAALNPAYKFNHAFLLPSILQSVDDIDVWRKRYSESIERLFVEGEEFLDPSSSISGVAFNLAYHNRDNKKLLETVCRLFREKCPSLNFVSKHIGRQPTNRGRLRVAIASEFLRNHTIGKLVSGFVEHLDRDRFEVILIHTASSMHDSYRKHLDSIVDKAVTLPKQLKAQLELVEGLELDALFYPDIGMSKITYFLGFARLAPVQLVSWGHPETTGLDTMDYFLSSKLIEGDQCSSLYSERLVRLNRLPCFYDSTALGLGDSRPDIEGLPREGTLYGCPQSLFKIHVDFDKALAKIAERDPTGHIIFIEDKGGMQKEQLKQRWALSHPILLEKVVFLPRLPNDRFLTLVNSFDVLLDPFYFGSGNTMYEALHFGKPIVTMPGKYMRGRIVAGAYAQMGLENAPVATNADAYAEIACELGKNRQQRLALSKQIKNISHKVFNDKAAVAELEEFLEVACEAATRGQFVQEDWFPQQTKSKNI